MDSTKLDKVINLLRISNTLAKAQLLESVASRGILFEIHRNSQVGRAHPDVETSCNVADTQTAEALALEEHE